MSIIQITTTTNSTMSSTTTTATCSDLSPMTKERTHSLSSTTSSSSLFSSISALSSPSSPSTSSLTSPSSSPSSSSISSTTKECARMAALASKWANRKCAVCSAPAKSFNYNALTCQSCRLFFFRHAWQRNSLVCFGDQNCPMVGVARKCQKCRMDRCLAKGMEPRRVKFNRNKLAAAHHYNHYSHHSLSLHSTSSPFFLNSSSSSSEILHAEDLLLNNSSNSNSPSTSTSTSPESSMEMYYLQALTAATRHIPNEAVLPSSRTEVDFEAVLNLPSLYLKYVGSYCREMYGFKELAEGQQARLFKAFFPQFIIARLASVLDPKLLTFRALADDTGIHVTVIQPASLGNLWYGSLLFETMSNLLPLTTLFDGDTVIRDLFTALLYFQAGQQVMPHFEVMRYHYHIYSNLLRSYLVSKYSGGSPVNPVERHRQLLAFNQVMEAAAVTAKVRLGLIFNVSEQVFGYRFRLDEALEKIFDIPLYQRHFPLNSSSSFVGVGAAGV